MEHPKGVMIVNFKTDSEINLPYFFLRKTSRGYSFLANVSLGSRNNRWLKVVACFQEYKVS